MKEKELRNFETILSVSVLENFIDKIFKWRPYGGSESEYRYVTLEDVIDYINTGGREVSEVYSTGSHNKDKDWHMGRVTYFVNRPSEIESVRLLDDGGKYVKIADGNHRTLAAIILKDMGVFEEMTVLFTGRKSVLDQLVKT